jgi:RecB family exonuclease/PAS domain-containing protein
MSEYKANHVLFTGHLAYLEAQFLDRVGELKPDDPLRELWVIVPNQLTRLHLRKMLARRFSIVANVRFKTVTELMHALAEPVVLREGWKTLGESIADPLLATIISGVKGQLTYLAPVADSAGFRRALLRTRQELINHRIAPDDLLRVTFATRERAAKIGDLVLLLNMIAKELNRLKLHDAAHLQTLALRGMTESVRHGVPILAYSLCELEPLTLAVFEKLLATDSMDVFLPNVADRDEYVHTHLLWMWYLDHGFTEIFDDAPETEYPPIRFVSAPHDTSVAEETVRDILHTAEIGAGEAAVLLPGSSRTLTDILESRCSSAGLTPYIYQARTLGETPAGRGLAAFAALLNAEFTIGQVKAYLSSAPFVDTVASRAGEWIRLAEESLVIAGAAEWEKRIEQKIAQLARRAERKEREPDADDQALAGLRRRIESGKALQEFLKELFAVIKNARTAESWESGVRVLWEYYARVIVMDEEFADLTLQLEQSSVADDAEVQFSAEGLSEFILATLKTPGLRMGSFSSGTPIVVPREQNIGASFPHIFLPGFNEGTLPHAQRQDPLLLDRDREEINAALGSELRLAKEWKPREDFLLEMQLRAATESITIYIARADADGRPQLRSPYVAKLLETQSGEETPSEEFDKIIVQAPNRYVAAHPLEACDPSRAISASEYHRLALGKSLKTGDAWLSYLHDDEAMRAALELEAKRFRAEKFTTYDGRMEDAAVLKHLSLRFSPEHPVDASGLEEYWQCPFRYVAAREWEAYTPEELDPLNPVSPLERGSLYHNILENFHGALLNKPIASEFYSWNALRDVAVTAIKKFARSNPVGPKYAAEKFEREVLAVLKKYFDSELNEGNWRTRYVEARFGFGDGEFPEPVQYTSADNRFIRFRGRLDRWDSDDSGAMIRITDYKTGKEPEKKSRAYHRRLQLAIYNHVAKSKFEQALVRARYLYVKSGHEESQTDEAMLRRTLEESVNLLSDLRAGVFVPDPALEDSAVCKNCAVKLACGAQRHASKELRGNAAGMRTARFEGAEFEEGGNDD